ncbi:serine/threonine-protein kinase [Candidatus Uabimicrobium amorphum]|uniref:non-specific serine/threonine protein kinase n=1 Tax=Uabimicrobium amorphum TaxID=2596890 RepID=A0A5S9IIH7_UABAM|nr:serine/threonine-protein kinase [Candidatus Uabimicrobium amorphum]BBM82096.1 serine/threonine protein kinase [Candidatus Uabimicrobium amorphum]
MSTQKIFGKYLLEKEIGRGGMGIVYKAYDNELKRTVALKILLQNQKQDVERFRNECVALAKLEHPNIVRFYEYGEKPSLYYTMEYCEGVTLQELIKKQQMRHLFVVDLLIDVCKGIAAVHSKNIVHRDIKPSNIMYTKDNKIKIMDFGLAKRILSDPGNLSKTGDIVGTITYMSPDQIAGKISTRVDIYALGALLYECLTYQELYRGDSPQNILFQILHESPIIPRKINDSISPYLEAICLKCIHKDPQKRYSSCKQLEKELINFKKKRPILAKKYGFRDQVQSFLTRYKLLLSFSLLLIAFVTVSIYYKKNLQRVRRNVIVEDCLKRAEVLIRNDNFKQALEEYNKALIHFPNHVQVKASMLRMKQIQEQKVKAAIAQGNNHLKQQQFVLAIGQYNKGLTYDLNCWLYFGRGKAKFAQQKFLLAIEDFEHAIQLEKHLEFFHYRGVAYRYAEEYQKALADYNHILQKNPNHVPVLIDRSRVYEILKQYTKAYNDTKKALTIYSLKFKKNPSQKRLGENIRILEKRLAKLERNLKKEG